MCFQKRKNYPSRWFILAACLMLMCLTGTQYAFGLISDTIKDGYHLSQQQIDTIALFGNIGAYSGVIPGIFNNRFGPSVSIWFGIVTTTCGIALLTTITNKMFIDIISSTSTFYLYYAMFSNFVFNWGLAWFGCLAAPCIARNFPKVDHSKLLGMAKGYLGIGSAFISIFKTNIADDNVHIFMISILIFVPIAGILCAYFAVILPNKNIVLNYQSVTEMGYKTNNKNINIHKDGANFTYWYLTAVTFAVYLAVISLLQNIYHFQRYIQLIMFAGAIILYYLPTIFARFCHGPNTIENIQDTENINIQTESVKKDNEIDSEIDSEIGMPGIFTYKEFWLLYLTYAIIGGVGLTFINNVSQIVESASSTGPTNDNENKSLATSLVTIISFGSFAGRTSGGFIAGTFNKLHCTFWLILCPLFMTISQLFLTFIAGENLILLFIGGVTTGYSFGWMFSLMMIAITDLWGAKYLSGNYALFDSAAAFGGLIFSTLIFGKIYDKNAIDNKCYGDKCYKYSFLICSGASIIALLCTIIVWRIQKRKQKLLIQPLLY